MKHTVNQISIVIAVALLACPLFLVAPKLVLGATPKAPFPPGSYLKPIVVCGDFAPCHATVFTPRSSVQLVGRVIFPYLITGENPIYKGYKGVTSPTTNTPGCTPVWENQSGYHDVNKLIGNHVIFIGPVGNTALVGHCLEDPSVKTRKPLVLQASTAPGAMTTGTAFTKSVEATRIAQVAPSTQPAAPSASGSNASSNALLIGGLVAGAAALAVAAGAAAKSSTSSSSSGTVNCSYNLCFCNPGVPCGHTVNNEQTQCLSQDVVSVGQTGCGVIDSSDGYTIACQPNDWCYQANGTSSPGICESSFPSQCS